MVRRLPAYLHRLALAALALALTVSGTAAADRLFRCDDLAERAQLSARAVPMYQGDEGFFYQAADFNNFYMMSSDTLAFLTRLRDGLARHGVTLVLMPVPPKAVMTPTHAVTAAATANIPYDPDYARLEFEGLIADLQARGLAVVDIMAYLASDPIASGDLFFARDIHWRPILSKVSADAVTALLRKIVGPDIIGTKRFVTTEQTGQTHASNVNLVLNQLCSTKVPDETMDLYTTEEADQSVDSFLGDATTGAAVSVVGTSFTAEDGPYNFSGFLREDLQSDIATYSLNGGGVDAAISKFIYNDLPNDTTTKVLLWEIPYAERLEQLTPALERQLVPGASGLCTPGQGQLASQQYSLAAGGSFTFKIDPALHASGHDFYVAATLSDPATQTFSLLFDYKDGQQDVFPVTRPDRVTSAPNLFAELSNDIDSDVTAVTLTSPNALSGTISLCRYPPAAPSSDTASLK